MPVLRELLVKLGFNVDEATVEKAENAINGVKQTAKSLDEGLALVGEAAARAAEKVQAAWREVPGELDAIDEQAKLLGKGFSAAEEKARLLGATIRQLASEGIRANDPLMQQMGAMRQKFAAQAEREGEGGMLGRIGGSIKETALAVGGPIAAMFAAEQGAEHFAEFQQTMQKTGAAMRASQADIQDMQDKALSWVGVLGRSPREIGEAMQELASQGFQKAQVEAMTQTAVKLARAGMTDISTSTGIIGATSRMFYGENVNAQTAGHVGDVIAMVHDLGGIQVAQLAESMKYAAPAFAAMGQSVESLGAMTAALGRAGIQGSMAGASLRTMMLKLAAPMSVFKTRLEAAGLGGLAAHASKGENMLEVLGISQHDLLGENGQMKALPDILEMIVHSKGFAGSNKLQQAGILKQLFGIENSATANALLSQIQSGGFAHISSQVDHANGRLQQMYDIMNRGLIPAWQRLLGHLEVLADYLMGALSPALVGLMNGLSAVMGAIESVVGWFKKTRWAATALKLAFVALAPGALIIALTALAALMVGVVIPAVVSFTVAAWSAAAGVIAATWPILAVGAAIAAVVLVVQDLLSKNSVLRKLLGEAWQWLATEAHKLGAAVGGVVGNIIKWFESLPGRAIGAFKALAVGALQELEKIPGFNLLLNATGLTPAAGLAGGGGGVSVHAPVQITVHGTVDHKALAAAVGDHVHGAVRAAMASAGRTAPVRKR